MRIINKNAYFIDAPSNNGNNLHNFICAFKYFRNKKTNSSVAGKRVGVGDGDGDVDGGASGRQSAPKILFCSVSNSTT